MKYQIVLTSATPQIISKPLSFNEANDLACLLQADIQAEDGKKIPVSDIFKHGEFFVVEPIISKP